MKVKKLIEILQQYDENMEVFVDGYEDGIDRLFAKNIKPEKIKLNWEFGGGYYGKHEINESKYNIIGIVLHR